MFTDLFRPSQPLLPPKVVSQLKPYMDAGATRIILPYVAASGDIVGEMRNFIHYWNPAITATRPIETVTRKPCHVLVVLPPKDLKNLKFPSMRRLQEEM